MTDRIRVMVVDDHPMWRDAVCRDLEAAGLEVVALGGNRQLCTLYESVLVRLQLYMAVNLRREAEVAEPSDGVHRHERLLAAVAEGDSASIIAALSGHGARTYLP